MQLLRFVSADHCENGYTITQSFSRRMKESEMNLLPNQGGTDERRMRREDFVALFADFLDTQLYGTVEIASKHRPLPPEVKYISNQAFWADAIDGRHYDGKRISLKDFMMLEWIPLSPGRFYNANAAEKRNQAKEFYEHVRGEYLPLGKLDMILGGIGSLRLGSRPIGRSAVHVVGLSSSGVSHEGIPATLNEGSHHALVKQLRMSGGVIVDAVGTLRSMPMREWRTWRTDGVPTIYLSIEEIDIRPSMRPVVGTVSIMFPSPEGRWSGRDDFHANGYSTTFSKAWSYASFDPQEGPEDLRRAATWLQEYASRYSSTQEPAIFSDFDELYPHFDSPVEFSLTDAAMGTIDGRRLLAYSQHYGVQINIHELRVGDTFSDVTNATIINRSTVAGALKGSSAADTELRSTILKIVDFINRNGNSGAAVRLNALIDELCKPAPQKALLGELWRATLSEAPEIRKLGAVAAKVEKLCS